MLARADLSASHERSAFTDLATAHQTTSTRRGESLGSQHGRTSTGQFGAVNGQGITQSQFNHSINSLLEAPVDDLLDELRAGGDFEGFLNMGLDDEEFDALRQEIIFTKVCSVPAEHSNVRYSSQHVPAKSQCKIFTLNAPTSAEQDQQTNTIVICILDPDEKRLLVLTVYVKSHQTAPTEPIENGVKPSTKGEKNVTVATLGPVMRAKGVIDACRLDDGRIARILVLTETPDGYGELSLQAPWSVLMKVPLPRQFNISNIRNLSHDATPRAKREGGFKRVLSQGPRALCGLRNSKMRGLVDLVDSEGNIHQLQILLQPRNPQVCRVIEVCRAVIPSTRGGEGILVAWWHAMQWLRLEPVETTDLEWTALVITLFSMVLGMGNLPKTNQIRSHAKRKSRSGHLRSSSGAQSDLESWDIMQTHETSNGNPCPPWAENRGWKWLGDDEEDLQDLSNKQNSDLQGPIFASNVIDKSKFIQKHVKFARDFVTSTLGQGVLSGCLPTTGSGSLQTRTAALTDTFVALHLLREEQKLDTMSSDSFTTGVASLTPVLAQIARWLGWTNWVSIYDVEEASALDILYDSSSPIDHLPELFSYPSIYDWIQMCLPTRRSVAFITLPTLVTARSSKQPQDFEEWSRLTPRTLLFTHFFSSMRDDWSSVDFIEALSAVGMNKLILETLPEAVLVPLQEAIVQCQAAPPTMWSKTLLAIVGREDVNVLLTPGSRPRYSQPYALLVSA
jgi:anaphase-promoting complex subunit 1